MIKTTENILRTHDHEIYEALIGEHKRQQDHLELIASENFVSQAVLAAQGSILTNKYAEGYPGHRYYGGCEYVDRVEELAQNRLKALFNCQFVNVQPHSGSQANQAVFLALLEPGDPILGMSLSSGGHLTHGSPVNMSGKWFRAVTYDVDPVSGLLDYDLIRDIALRERPKILIAGISSYPRVLDFQAFRAIADEIGAYLMVDIAHFAGLVAGGVYPSPLPWAHVVTSTTHKTLRGPRGGIILTQDEAMAKKINSALFPGLQGGPLMHVIAAKAVAFEEALRPSFRRYTKSVVENAQILAQTLMNRGLNIITGGTDIHLLVVNLQSHELNGRDAERLLEKAHVVCNKNSIPFDTLPPKVTSGIRLGSPACTTRGMAENEFREIGNIIADLLLSMKASEASSSILSESQKRVQSLCQAFPVYVTSDHV